MFTPEPNSALIVVDLQRDFCPGGALPVPGGDAIIPLVNTLMERFYPNVFMTVDCHPANHCSFRENGGIWPPHCVAGSAGMRFAEGLDQRFLGEAYLKGTNYREEAYSGFSNPGLKNALRRFEAVYLCGLALDYCVKATALDAVACGLKTRVVLDATRGVSQETTREALSEMVLAGVIPVTRGNFENLGGKTWDMLRAAGFPASTMECLV